MVPQPFSPTQVVNYECTLITLLWKEVFKPNAYYIEYELIANVLLLHYIYFAIAIVYV